MKWNRIASTVIEYYERDYVLPLVSYGMTATDIKQRASFAQELAKRSGIV